MKKITLLLAVLFMAGALPAQYSGKNRIEKLTPLPAGHHMLISEEGLQQPLSVHWPSITGNRAMNKISFSSSANVYGLFVYEQKYLTLQQDVNMFIFGNRAGGSWGNTGNDLKFKFTTDQGLSWDSVVVAPEGTKNYRYPSLVTYNPGGGSNPDNVYGIISGPIVEGSTWTSQFCGSIRFDGQKQDLLFVPMETGTYLNHMNIGLYCSPDGHATVASQRLNGTSTAVTYDGWEVLNGTFNAGAMKFDWNVPFVKVQPAVLEDGRIDASMVAYSPDGSVGYLLGTAIDADPTYNPYGVEWPVIYKTTDHGLTWAKTPAFDFSTIPIFQQWLYGTRIDPNKVIPRWYNKWASPDNQSYIGTTVDKHNNLHIFGEMRSTMSINPDSLNYFYSDETPLYFDVYMKPGGGWDAFLVDSTITDNAPDPGTYGTSWDHHTQMTRSADGSKVFFVWTDSDPVFGPENLTPDIKGMGYDAITGMATPVKSFTANSLFAFENYWVRVADQVFYDQGRQTYILPVTTSIPGSLNTDPLVHQYFTGLEIAESEFSILVGQPDHEAVPSGSAEVRNYPNPMRDATTVSFTLSKSSGVSVELFNITGKKILTIDRGTMTAGTNQIVIKRGSLVSGVYFYTIVTDEGRKTGRMIVE